MTKYLLKCKNCGQYGLANPELKCRHCGGQLVSCRPPKFSLIDKYGKYRLIYFKEEFEKKYNKKT
ncbi:MAG: nucleolar RNA-binding Nop10p family protein [Promethearchaeota archaeon]